MLRNDVQAAENFAEFLIKGYPAGSLIELILFNAWHDYQTNHFAPSPPGRPITMAGLFDRWDHVGCAAARTKDVSIYINPNPIRRRPGLTETNKIERIKKGECVRKSDLEFLRWLIIDIDPVVPGGRNGLNATETEHQACLDLMRLILNKEPMIDEASLFGSSGNGAFLIVRVDDLPVNDETRALVAAFVATLILKYPGQAAAIDPGSKDISKKISLPGTLKCRGPHSEVRPRRLVTIHGTDRPVTPLDLAAWLRSQGIDPFAKKSKPQVPAGLNMPSAPRIPGSEQSRIDKARHGLSCHPGAIQGKAGDQYTFALAIGLIKGFDLSEFDALSLLSEWNAVCQPPWTEHELAHKIEYASKAPDERPRGYLLIDGKPRCQESAIKSLIRMSDDFINDLCDEDGNQPARSLKTKPRADP